MDYSFLAACLSFTFIFTLYFENGKYTLLLLLMNIVISMKNAGQVHT